MSFRLGSIPVRIQPWFWLTALLLGGNLKDPRVIAMWVAIVFVSVLVHELGHAFAGIAFGLVPQIDLHGMGGTTSWVTGKPLGHGRSIVVSLAGPLLGIALGICVWLALALGWEPTNVYAANAARITYQVNIVWGLFNLVPLLPLDGGNVMRSTLNLLTGGRGEKPARVISIITAMVGMAYAVKTGGVWLGILAALFGFRNFQALRSTDARRVDAEVLSATDLAYRALERQDGAEAIRIIRPVLTADASPELLQAGTRILAYALLIEDRWGELLPLLERDKALVGREELERYARTARELGRQTEADVIDRLVASA